MHLTGYADVKSVLAHNQVIYLNYRYRNYSITNWNITI